MVKDNLFAVPPLFSLIQKESGTPWSEMYRVFNCGHRMEIYVDEGVAEDLIAIASSFGIDAQIVGHVKGSESKKLTIQSPHGTFSY